MPLHMVILKRIPLLTKNKEIPLFSFVRTDRQTDGQIKLDCVAKTSLSAESNDCRLAANILEHVISLIFSFFKF